MDLQSLEIRIVRLESDLEYLKNNLNKVELDQDSHDGKREVNSQDIVNIKIAILQIEESIVSIKTCLARLDRNVFLQFTNDIDLKKLIAIIVVCSTLLTSPTIFSSFLGIPQTPPSNTGVDRLIELLEKRNANP